MRQMDRQRLVLQYLHDNCLSEGEVEIIFEPTGGLSHRFKQPKIAIESIPDVNSQITDSVTSDLSLHVNEISTDSTDQNEPSQDAKVEVDASKKKRPPPPKKKS